MVFFKYFWFAVRIRSSCGGGRLYWKLNICFQIYICTTLSEVHLCKRWPSGLRGLRTKNITGFHITQPTFLQTQPCAAQTEETSNTGRDCFGHAKRKLSPTMWIWFIAESCLVAFTHAVLSQNKAGTVSVHMTTGVQECQQYMASKITLSNLNKPEKSSSQNKEKSEKKLFLLSSNNV